jgi:hypothetical protein
MRINKTIRASVTALSLALLATLAFAAAPAMAEFGVERFAVSARNEDGTADVQAGSHPYALTVALVLKEPGGATGNVKDVKLQLPPGLVGNPDATPKCTYREFVRQLNRNPDPGRCSNETVVGIATFYGHDVNKDPLGAIFPSSAAVYNLVPPAGVAAELGYIAFGHLPVVLQETVRTGGDYGVTTTSTDIGEAIDVAASKVTIWGVPADHAHDRWRGECERVFYSAQFPLETAGLGLREGEDELEGPLYVKGGEETEFEGMPYSVGECPSTAAPKPLLTLPTSCGRPLTATVSVDSWQEPGNFIGREGDRTRSVSLPELTGCGELPFTPSLGVKPDTDAGSTPAGVDFELGLPQESTEALSGLAEADLKGYRIALPEGLQLNASSVNGLESCSPAQVGFTGFAELDPSGEPGVRTPQFTPAPAECPDASKLGTVTIKSPLLEGELHGAVYLAAPQNYQAGPLENPFKSLTATYVVAEEERTGVIVKLPGDIERNPETGQLTAILSNSPQLPFSTANIDFFTGERAPLATGPRCGSYTTSASFEAWSATPPFATFPTFPITSGPGGSACPSGALPFSPSLVSGTASNDAGGFGPLTTLINRADGQQAIHDVTISYPPGVSAVLSGVPECPEEQANAGTCGAESLIGEDTASVGLGQDPYTVTGGRVYLTGPYEGAPFGLSIVTPTKAGPFILEEGRPVVTRARIEINPTTAAVTVTTGEIPRILDGIPLQVKQITVNINRPNFAINPTSCEHMTVSGAIAGWEGSSFPVSDPFQVAGCQSLKFAPKFSASTAGKTSKLLGASLVTKIEEPAGALGSEANIAKVKVQLPLRLPSQLKTLQKACLAKTFEISPEACFKESKYAKVGEATVDTPLLPVPLTGNAYLVSHGGEAFPSLTIVLNGDNVTIVLVGTTNIKNGITTTTFKTTPDVPFTSFQLTLPQGEYSALGSYLPSSAKGSFCKQNLVMPTEIIAQNGMALYQDTKIAVADCPPAVTVTNASVKGNSVVVTVKLGQAGTLVLSGKGIRRETIHDVNAGTRTIAVSLTATGRAARKHDAKLKITAELTAGGHTGTTTKSLTA